MADEQEKQDSRRVQAVLEGKPFDVFNDLASLLPIGDAAIIKTLILKYGPVEIADLRKSENNKSESLSQ